MKTQKRFISALHRHERLDSLLHVSYLDGMSFDRQEIAGGPSRLERRSAAGFMPCAVALEQLPHQATELGKQGQRIRARQALDTKNSGGNGVLHLLLLIGQYDFGEYIRCHHKVEVWQPTKQIQAYNVREVDEDIRICDDRILNRVLLSSFAWNKNVCRIFVRESSAPQ